MERNEHKTRLSSPIERAVPLPEPITWHDIARMMRTQTGVEIDPPACEVSDEN